MLFCELLSALDWLKYHPSFSMMCPFEKQPTTESIKSESHFNNIVMKENILSTRYDCVTCTYIFKRNIFKRMK